MSGALAAARREAEELLGALAGCYRSPVERDLINAVAALLAALPGETPAPQPAPTTCPGCGGLGWIPAGDELTEPRLTAILSRVACGDSDYSDAQALAAELKRRHPGHDRIGELESLLRECNAVCLCGCPDSEHEADECGEGCGNDDHECIRVAPAVLAYVNRLRSRALLPGVEAAAEDVVRGDWWGHYCPSCGSTFKHGPECRIGRLAKALDSARGAKGGAE